MTNFIIRTVWLVTVLLARWLCQPFRLKGMLGDIKMALA